MKDDRGRTTVDRRNVSTHHTSEQIFNLISAKPAVIGFLALVDFPIAVKIDNRSLDSLSRALCSPTSP